jgi:hypothetical protein
MTDLPKIPPVCPRCKKQMVLDNAQKTTEGSLYVDRAEYRCNRWRHWFDVPSRHQYAIMRLIHNEWKLVALDEVYTGRIDCKIPWGAHTLSRSNTSQRDGGMREWIYMKWLKSL